MSAPVSPLPGYRPKPSDKLTLLPCDAGPSSTPQILTAPLSPCSVPQGGWPDRPHQGAPGSCGFQVGVVQGEPQQEIREARREIRVSVPLGPSLQSIRAAWLCPDWGCQLLSGSPPHRASPPGSPLWAPVAAPPLARLRLRGEGSPLLRFPRSLPTLREQSPCQTPSEDRLGCHVARLLLGPQLVLEHSRHFHFTALFSFPTEPVSA